MIPKKVITGSGGIVAVGVRVTVGVRVVVGVTVTVGVEVAVRVTVGVRVVVGDGCSVGVRVGRGGADGVNVPVGVAERALTVVLVAVGDPWPTVALSVGVEAAVRVRVGLGCAVGVTAVAEVTTVAVAVPFGVELVTGRAVRVGVGDPAGSVGGRVGGSVIVGEVVRRDTAVHVGVAVLAAVGLCVGIAEFTDVGLGVAVAVEIGWLPMRTTICDGTPKFPLTSRTSAVTTVSPNGNAFSAFTTMQNCTTCGSWETKLGAPKASTVQARVGLVLTSKPQLKSFNAFDTGCVKLKSGGLKPGMPPAVHTPASPSPSDLDASTCKSGRSLGSLEFQLNSNLPTSAPALPGTASRTSWKPEPAAR